MIRFRPKARRDILDILAYLETQSASASIRRRFLVAFEETCLQYERWPKTAPRVDAFDQNGQPLRRFTVRHFPKYLAFYREHADGITIFRVLHGARDLPLIWDTKPLE